MQGSFEQDLKLSQCMLDLVVEEGRRSGAMRLPIIGRVRPA
jgi:hypothetical protein